MHAMRILHRCLGAVLDTMHAARVRRLLRAVDALAEGRRLTLTDLARSWPGAELCHAPLKALDRLLSNRHLHAEAVTLYQGMMRWLMRRPNPLVLVDWSDLKRDGRWCLLRAAVPIGGRALTVFEQVFPISRMGSPRAERAFLRAFKRALPKGIEPIVVTDAGFRREWCETVRALGWHYVVRLRNNTLVEWSGDWQPCKSLHELASSSPRDLGVHRVVRQSPMETRLVLQRRLHRGRHSCTRAGQPQRGTSAEKARKREREPWLLITSLTEPLAAQIVAMYAKRMQIEEAFRDLKSHRHGMAFEDSLTRKPKRLAVLLLLHALATYAAWLMGLAAEAAAAPDPLTRQVSHRARYSHIRRGLQWLRQRCVPPTLQARLSRAALWRLSAEGL